MNPLLQNSRTQTNGNKSFGVGDILKFASGFKGNPEQEIQRLLQSGQMTRAEFETYKRQARNLFKNIRF